jgi:hypothetical protein
MQSLRKRIPRWHRAAADRHFHDAEIAMSYRCTVCGELHDDLPDLGSDRPDGWWGIPAEERSRRVVLTADTCVIDDEDYYIRGVIEIPIHGQTNRFGFGAWVSQKRENFLQYVNNPNSANIGPFFGWLCTRISYYEEETLHLKSRAHFRGGGLRPSIELEPTDNPLAIDQRNGIELAKAWEIVHFFMPPTKSTVEHPGEAGSGNLDQHVQMSDPLVSAAQEDMKTDADDWPFDQPPNCAVITLWPILNGLEPIRHVTHDSDDHGWQFLGLGDAEIETSAVVSLRHIVEKDPSVRDLADLPPGWHAWRGSIAEPWIREPKPLDEDG